MTERQNSEALHRLNQGIEESRRSAQRQGMQATQEYFGDFIESLKRQVYESRSNLEGLPEQVPGGQEESFQKLFQELMSNYSKVEGCLEQARKNVDDLDLDRLGQEQARSSVEALPGMVEVEASETARREAEELGIDLTRISGTGSEGRVVADDVKRAAGARKADGAGEDSREAVRDRKLGEPRATDAARREAEKLGIGLSEVEATGADGQVIVSDVVEFAENRGKLPPESPDGSHAGGLPAIDRIEEVSKSSNGQVEETTSAPNASTPDASTPDASTPDASTPEIPAGDSPREPDLRMEDAPAYTASDALGEEVWEPVREPAVRESDVRELDVQEPAVEEPAIGESAIGEPGREPAVREPERVTSAARRKAEDLGVDLSRVEGSGVGGLVTIKDVLKSSR